MSPEKDEVYFFNDGYPMLYSIIQNYRLKKMANKISNKFVKIVIAITLTILSPVRFCFAEYNMSSYVLDTNGTEYSNVNYKLLSAGGQSIIGYSTTTVYDLGIGYIYTIPTNAPPNIPTNLNIDLTGTTTGQIKWIFTDNAANETGLYVSSGTNATMRLSPNLANGSFTGTTSWIEPNLTANTSYQRFVEATNGVGSVWSVSITSYTFVNPPVSSSFTNVWQSSVAFNWSANGNPSYTRWGILRSTDNFVTSTTTLTNFDSNYTDINYIDVELQYDTTYWYKVQAFNGDVLATAFDTTISTITLSPPDNISPAAISDLTALTDANDGEIVLKWTAPGDDGIEGNLLSGSQFQIKYSSVGIINSANYEDASHNVINISTSAVVPLSACNFVVKGLKPGATYWFATKTKDDSNNWSIWNSKDDSPAGGQNTAAYIYIPSVVKSVTSGDWNNPNTWENGNIPWSSQSVQIQNGHSVTFNKNDSTVTCSNITIYGTLQFDAQIDTRTMIVAGNVDIQNGGQFLMPPNTGYVSTLKIRCEYNGQYGISVNGGGIFDVQGSSMAFWRTTLSVQVNSGATNITTNDNTGWKVGDKITLATTHSIADYIEEKTITSISGTNITINTVLSSTHNAGAEVVNITRNCVITSDNTSFTTYISNLSQTEANFNMRYVEASYLGTGSYLKYGITFSDSLARGKINYCSIHNGYHGINLFYSSNNTISNNSFYSNTDYGIRVVNGSNNTINNNSCYSNNYGIYLHDSSNNNTISNNNCYSNTTSGIFLNSSFNNTLRNNSCYSNSTSGIYLYGSYNNTLSNNSCYLNASKGISIESSSNNTLNNNSCYSNDDYGIYAYNSINNTALNCELGKGGNNNTSGDIGYESGFVSKLTLKNCNLYSTTQVDTARIDTAGSYLVSYNQDGTSGTTKIWGDYNIPSGSTGTFNYANPLYVSNATMPNSTLYGTGSITYPTTNDNQTLTEFWEVKYNGSNFDVKRGTWSVLTNDGTATVGSPYISETRGVGFTVTGPFQLNDAFYFVTISSSADQNVQKKIEFNDSPIGTKMFVGGTVQMIGTPAYPTISTSGVSGVYYGFCSSGSINLQNYILSNLRSSGLEIYPNATVVDLSSGTFDNIQQGSADSSYIRVKGITSTRTFYGCAFNDMPGTANYNVHADGSGINWTFLNWSGVKAGENYDYEVNGANIYWDTPPAKITDLVATVGPGLGELTLCWTAPGDDGTIGNIVNGQYQIKYSTYLVNESVACSNIIWSTNTSPGNIERKVITGLESGTTYYFQIRTADANLNWADDWSNVASARTFYILQSTDTVVSVVSNVSVNIVSTPAVSPDISYALSTATLQGLYLVSNIYDIKPDGTVFSPPAELTFKYDPAIVIDTSTLAIYKWTGVNWTSATITNQVVLDSENPRIVGNISSVSYYGLFLYDKTPPQITVSSPISGEKFIATISTITINYSVKDNLDPDPKVSAYLTDLEEGTTVQMYNGQTMNPLTIDDGFWTLTVEATDWVGNYSSSTTARFEVIHDIQPPQTTVSVSEPKYNSFITSSTLIMLSSVDDLINVGDGKGLGVKETKYKIDDSEWQVYTTSFTVPTESSHTITYYSLDVIGNTEQSQTLNVTVDNTAPTTGISISSPQYTSDDKLWVSSETAVSLSATDGGIIPCGVKYTEYRINNGQWINYTTGFNLTGEDGNYTIDYRSSDNLDNLETYKTLIVQLDNIPPVTAVTIVEPKYVSDGKIWITTSTAITLASMDIGCGVKNIAYKIDDSVFTVYLSTFCLTTLPEGEHTIYFRSADNLNNTEQEKSVKVIIDNTPPATNINIGSPKYTSDNKIWINNYTPITLSAEDGGITPSGVKSIAYKIDNSAWQLYAGAFDLGTLNEGEHIIYYYSVDNVNNTEQIKSIKVILDVTSPSTQILPSEPKYDNYITSNTIFTLNSTDGGVIPSGVKYSQYNINNQFWSIYIQQFNITGADGIYTINYQSIDNVENWETIKSTTVKLDNTAPVSALTISDGKQYTSSDSKLYSSIDTKYIISAEDPVINEVASGLAKIEYAIDGSSFTVYTTSITLTEGIHTITYRGIDKLGNTESVKTFNVNVDNTPPVTQHTINGIQYTSDSKIYITPASVIGFTMIDPTVSGVASGISYTKCRIDAGEFQNIPSTYTFTLAEGIHTVEYYSADNVNNTETVKQITLYVDNTAPVTEIIVGEPKYTAFGETYISPRTPILITATDPVSNNVSSGVDEIQYSIDGSDFVKYVSSFTLTEGSHTIDYRSIDNVQNMETTKLLKLNVVYISEYAVFGVDEIKINGQGKVYGNARSNGNVKLSGQAFINGDVSASSITLTGQSKITGTLTQNVPAISTSAIDLASLQTQVSQNNDNSNIPKTQKGKSALVNGVLTLSGQDVLIITTGTYYLAGINLSGQTKLYLDGVVRIFCTGKIQVSGQSEVCYSGANPYNLIIYCNTTEPVTISGQGEMKGIIYAPASDISISGQGITISNVFGKTVSVGGQGKIVGATYTQPPMLAVGIPKPAPPLSDFILGEVYSFPNPAKRGKCPTIHIEVGLADILEVRIYNVAGELVHSVEISGSNYKTINGKYAYEYNWDISNIASGVYIYLVRAKKNGYHDIKVQGKCAIIK